MKKNILFLFLIPLIFSCNNKNETVNVSIIPEPQNMEILRGTFQLNGKTMLGVDSDDVVLNQMAHKFSNEMEELTGLNFSETDKSLIGWDEILEGGLAPNATVMSWRGEKGGIEAAKMGHDVIMTPTDYCYFDYYQADPETEPLAIGGFLPIEKVYSYDPVPDVLTEKEAEHVLGVQANVWTEYIPDFKHVEYMIFPRMLAMSEVAWTEPVKKDSIVFYRKVHDHVPLFEKLGVNYSKTGMPGE